MATRLGIFIAVIIFGFGLLFTHPWINEDTINSHGGQIDTLAVFSGIAFVAFLLIRGIGWVFTGK